jgi:two-component system sporulation sensor kinase A
MDYIMSESRKRFWYLTALVLILLFCTQMGFVLFFQRSSWFTGASVFISLLAFAIIVFTVYRLSLFFSKIKKIAEEEKRWTILIDAMPDFVCFKDNKSRWVRVNEFGRELYQLEHVDYIGKTDLELGAFSPFFKEGFDQCFVSDEEAWQSGELMRVEESFMVPSGEQKSFDVLKIPLFYPNGDRKGLLTIGRDITQQKVAESMLIKQEKLSVVGELAAGIAHEIRNPLTSIKGLTQFMHETKNITDEYVNVMISEIDRINQIAGELLALSKPQSRSYSETSLREIIQYVLHIMQPEALLKDVQLIFCDDNNPKVIKGDRNELIQVFINFLKNAMEAMPNGGSIRIDTESDAEKVQITISDEGIGIPTERLNKIGEPFYTLKEKGMGLGLTISQKIIQQHHGTLELKSEEGVGTDVLVILPLIKQAAVAG